jgi:hypothetical protein
LRGSVFVHLDPRVEATSVPSWLASQPQLVLQIGLDLPEPIPDLRVDDDGVYGTLSFNRAPFTCVVPWEAVFALVGDDGKGMLWPESVPPEIAAEIARETGAEGPVEPSAEGGSSPPEDVSASGAADSDAESDPDVVSLDRFRHRRGPRERPAGEVRSSHDRTADDARHDRSNGEPGGPERTADADPHAGGPAAGEPHSARASRGRRELPPYLKVVK